MADSHDICANEIWKPIAGFEGIYEVSDQGRIRTLREYRQYKPGIRVGYRLPNGREVARLTDRHRFRRAYVYRLVLEAFVGPCPPGMECRHLNGDCKDNRLENLAWGTHIENGRDMKRHGKCPGGDRHPGSKMNWEQVREARKLRKEGASVETLRLKYGISKPAMYEILRCYLWVEETSDKAATTCRERRAMRPRRKLVKA